MRSVLCIIILNLILINSTSAKENWTVEKVLNDEFISISTFGEVTHGDRYRLLINTKGDCKSAEETFTFYTTANHPKILEIKNKNIPSVRPTATIVIIISIIVYLKEKQ